MKGENSSERAIKMKFLTKIIFIFALLLSFNAHAISILQGADDSLYGKIYLTSFADYFPFGYKMIGEDSTDTVGSVFRDVLSELKPKETNLTFGYHYFNTTSEAAIDMKTGKTHVFLGAFYATSLFDDFDFVFPSILNSPIHLMMLPDRITEVKTIEDLKNLKGIYVQNEEFSSHLLNIFQDIGLTPVQNTDEAYQKLLLGEVDFILGSFYYQYVKVLESGLKDYIAFSSRPLWNMPMFIALSKRYENRKQVHEFFRRIVSNDIFKEKVLARIKQMIEEKEEEFAGAVPPMYIRQSGEDELTPADEMQKENKE